MANRPTLAICHPRLGLGGSEAAVLWGITALREDYDITLVTASRVDLGKLNAAYGTDVEAGDFHLLRAPALPHSRNPSRLAHWRVKRFEQFCRTNTREFDIPLSAYNPIDFGRPGLHLVGDFSWDEEIRAELFASHGSASEPLHKGDLWLGSRLFGASGRDILDGRDLVAANSAWTAEMLAERFGLRDTPVLYPPVNVPTPRNAAKRGRGHFICLGRVSPHKGVERIIAILTAVRSRGHEDVRLTIIGEIGDDPYGEHIAKLAVANSSWIITPGYVGGERKYELLAKHPYALHACEGEAFGIAVAEMLLSGCVPFVPRSCGPAEIVGQDALCYTTNEEAVDKISRVLSDESHAADLRNKLATRGDRFTPQVFMVELRKLVRRFERQNKVVRAA